MEAFRAIQRKTQCPFAARAWVVPGPSWTERNGEAYLDAAAEALASFCATEAASIPDGFLLTLPARFGADVDALAATTNWILRGLSKRDPASGRCFDRQVESADWAFRFADVKLFVLTIGNCYRSDHARFGYGADATFLLLQPDAAFERHVTPGRRNIRQEVLDSVRIAFAEAGQIYDLTHTTSRFEAHRFVKPATLRSPAIRWWEASIA